LYVFDSSRRIFNTDQGGGASFYGWCAFEVKVATLLLVFVCVFDEFNLSVIAGRGSV